MLQTVQANESFTLWGEESEVLKTTLLAQLPAGLRHVAQVVERGFLTVAPKGAPFEQGRACLIAVNPNYATPAVPDPHATPHVRQ